MSTISAPSSDFRHTQRLIVIGGCVAFLLLLIRTAWLDDDAYITFRTVDNVLHGLGLRWNVANRVQSYTHPLWMFAMTGVSAVTGEVYFASLLLAIGVSIATVALIAARVAGSLPAVLFAFSAVSLSKAFVDYSTSGLENPLTHLLLAGLFVVQARDMPDSRRLFATALIAALLMVNRIDTALLVLPTLAAVAMNAGWRRAWRPLAMGLLPIVAWELFSLIYYGFPFPNTAYSKLQHGIPRGELLYQGFLYFLDSVANDPLTLLVIAAALLSPLAGVRRWTVSAGIALYLAYIAWVGGDFMSGRFFTAPFLLAVMLIASAMRPAFTLTGALALVVVWFAGLSAPRPTIVTTPAYGSDIEPARVIAPTGITDERRYYYPQSGLLNARRGAPMPNHKWLYMGLEARARGDRVLTTDAAGFIGYAAGPGVYFVDKYGLGDPLIARLPARSPWRIGHFERRVPDGYLESLAAGRNLIRDPDIAQYYEKLRIITEGPIWSRRRLRAIVQMNLGQFDALIAPRQTGD